jgi:Ca2+-binding EF-hand superfamily protein
MIVLYVMSSGSAEENLRQIFRIFDINDDGSISFKELKKIVKDLFHLLKKDGDPEKESDVRRRL